MAGADLLAGVSDTSPYTSNAYQESTYEFCASDDGSNLVTWSAAAGTADGVGVYIKSRLTSFEATIIVADGSGNHLGTTGSVSTTGWTDGWNIVDLVSSFTVADSDTILFWFAIKDSGTKYIDTYMGTTNWRRSRDRTGTYASPPDPFKTSRGDGVGMGTLALKLMGTFTAAGITIPVAMNSYRQRHQSVM